MEQAEAEIRQKEWEEAEYRVAAEQTLLPLLEYEEKYPESEFAEQAQELLEKMREDSNYYKHENLDELEYFIANFPGHKDIESALERRKDFEKNLMEFAQHGALIGRITGKSIREIIINIENTTKSRLIVNLPLGLYFMTNSGNIQNMVLTESMSVSVGAGEIQIITVTAACMNIYKDIPGNEDLFYLSMLEESDPLLKLLEILGDNSSVFEVVQAAIWHLRDNPGKQTMMEVLEYADGEKAITDEYYAEAVKLVEMVK